MRIGFSLVDLAMGGAQAFFVQLAQGLVARGHTATYRLAARTSDGPHVNPVLKEALDRVARQVGHSWDLWNADVIHLDGYHSLRRKLLYAPRWDRCLETYHSAYSVQRAGPLYPRHRIAVSQGVRDLLPLPAQVIYYGTESPTTVPNPKKLFDVALLGRIHPVKNHHLFLAVCEELYRRQGRCSALLIGGHPHSSPYQREIDGEVKRLRAAGIHLHLAGEVAPQSLSQWLCQVRVLLVTSHSEGFGRMAIEAMACGVPVVGNPVGGLLEIVQPGRTGFLAKKDDIDSFATKTLLLLQDNALRAVMGRWAQDRVRERFSLERMVSHYEAAYRSVIQLSRAG
jgi:glycosyltransferase involved in cell wall biosynthesis